MHFQVFKDSSIVVLKASYEMGMQNLDMYKDPTHFKQELDEFLTEVT